MRVATVEATPSAEAGPKAGSLPKGAGAFAAGAVLVTVGFALYTGSIWEDFFITFRHSQNLCEGKGLVYNEGERVHGFTSPLGVLLPALCYFLTGMSSYVAAIWLFRLLSALAFAGAGALFLRSLREAAPGDPWARVVFGFLFLFEAKSVAFSMNGMETALLLFFLAWALYQIVRDGPRDVWAGGLAWAGVMWTRPDGYVHILALALAGLAFCPGSRKALLSYLVRSGVIGAVLYVPWFAWAWWYYGSPVPNTVLAKSNYSLESALSPGAKLLHMVVTYLDVTAQVYEPSYYYVSAADWLDGTGFGWLVTALCYGLGVFSAFYWLVPVDDRLGRMASLCFALICVYLAFLFFAFPWYMPFAAASGLVAVARGATRLPRLLGRLYGDETARGAAWGAGVAVLGVGAAAYVALFALSAEQLRVLQVEVETGNRTAVGTWLKDRVRPGESVYLEPLGYIGYFSGAKMLDWPGLVSPRVVQLARERNLNQYTMIPALEPDWLVLRVREVGDLTVSPAGDYFLSRYTLVRNFDVSANLERYGLIPGRELLTDDTFYCVFRKKPAAGGAARG